MRGVGITRFGQVRVELIRLEPPQPLLIVEQPALDGPWPRCHPGVDDGTAHFAIRRHQPAILGPDHGPSILGTIGEGDLRRPSAIEIGFEPLRAEKLGLIQHLLEKAVGRLQRRRQGVIVEAQGGEHPPLLVALPPRAVELRLLVRGRKSEPAIVAHIRLEQVGADRMGDAQRGAIDGAIHGAPHVTLGEGEEAVRDLIETLSTQGDLRQGRAQFLMEGQHTLAEQQAVDRPIAVVVGMEILIQVDGVGA